MLISHGVRFNWYFHYMPIGDGANVDLMLNAEQREYMIHRVREIRGYTGGKPIFMGFCCWVAIACVSIAMQHLLGFL